MNDTSLYANCTPYQPIAQLNEKTAQTCCPKQMRGPALKGMNMKGLGMRYFCTRSSRKRSGSNSRADDSPTD